MSELSDKTLKTLKERKITPEPCWHFIVKNYALWSLFLVSIIIGALAVTTIIFMLTDHDWDVYKYLDRSFFEHVFALLPYFWIAVFSLFIVIADYSLKNTYRGYRCGTLSVVGGSILLSALLGILLFMGGIDSEIHQIFSRQVPFYNSLVYVKEDVWTNAEKGLLGGELVNIENFNDFTLQDLNGKIWQIKGENLLWPYSSLPQKGEKVKLIGQVGGSNIFFAKIVRPWND